MLFLLAPLEVSEKNVFPSIFIASNTGFQIALASGFVTVFSIDSLKSSKNFDVLLPSVPL